MPGSVLTPDSVRKKMTFLSEGHYYTLTSLWSYSFINNKSGFFIAICPTYSEKPK